MIYSKDIVLDGNPVLRKKCELVETPVSKDILKTLCSMREYLINSQDEELAKKYDLKPGVGLAAPQIGIPQRFLAICVKYDVDKFDEFLLINPEIIGESVQKTYLNGGEGCLSVPGKQGCVKRAKKVKIRTLHYYPETNEIKEETITFNNYLAIVFQHEFDHLNGVLFTDKITTDLEDVDPLE